MSKEKEQLHLSVVDNGQGIARELLAKLGKESVPSLKGTGSALENLNRRLHSLYDDKVQMLIGSDDKGTRFDIFVPIQWTKED